MKVEKSLLNNISVEMSKIKKCIDLETHDLKYSTIKDAAKRLKEIASEVNQETVRNYIDTSILIFCCLNLMERAISLNKIKTVRKIRHRFCKILSFLVPEKTSEIVDAVLNYLRDGSALKREYISVECFQCLSLCHASCDVILEKTLDLIEELIIVDKCEEAESVLRAFYLSIGENFNKLSSESLTRILSLYHLSVERSDPHNKFERYKSAFEIALRKIFQFVHKDELLLYVPRVLTLTFNNEMRSKTSLADFGLTIQEIFLRLSSSNIEKILKPEILEFLLNSISLKCAVKSFLACRFLALYIDHLKNFQQFSSPKIFYKRSLGNDFKVSKEEHKGVIDEYRTSIKVHLLRAIDLHASRRNNLNEIYCLICMMLLAMPSITTNIMIIDLLMDLQKGVSVKKVPKLSSPHKNQIHAFIISIMTLICCITKAKSLNKYIKDIVSARNNLAPHLLPPLRDFYEYEHYQELDFKANIFLDWWEIRYCLWKMYRLRDMEQEKLVFEAESDRRKNRIMKRDFMLRDLHA